MPEPSLTPVTVAVAALVGVLGIIAVGIATDVRVAVLLLGGFALLGAAARIVMPVSRAFAVRRRAVDTLVLLVLGLVLIFLGLTTPLA